MVLMSRNLITMQSHLSHTEVSVNPAINALCAQQPYNLQSLGLSMNHVFSGVDIQPPGGGCYSTGSPVASYPALVSPPTGPGIQGQSYFTPQQSPYLMLALHLPCIYCWFQFQAIWIPVPV